MRKNIKFYVYDNVKKRFLSWKEVYAKTVDNDIVDFTNKKRFKINIRKNQNDIAASAIILGEAPDVFIIDEINKGCNK